MDTYADLIFKLGDVAYERLWNKPSAPGVIEKVIKAAEAYEARQVELKELEQSMDAEEVSYNEFRDACAQEDEECQALVEKHAKAVSLAESKAKAIESKLVSRRKDVGASRIALAKFEKQVKDMEELGEADKARTARLNLKQSKLDLMKRSRDCDDMQTEYDKIMNPEVGPAAEAIRARRRQKDLEMQLEERTEAYNNTITQLGDEAAAKDNEIQAAKGYFDKLLYMLGEQVYQARIPDPALSAFYPKIDRVPR
ncbi:MAG TPA: hypothetical protein VGK67_15135 [Myxococcales bacterium]